MHVPHGIRPHAPQTNSSVSTHIATAPLPTRHGLFTTHVFASAAHAPNPDGTAPEKEHVALVFGEVKGKMGILARVHSECITSEVFGSLKCDCKEQLDAAMGEAARRGAGVILYLRQEGRGIGLGNKIRAYDLQSRGHDTVDANRLLGLPDDARRYDVARDMLEWLGVKSIRLMTNNPEKVQGLRALGVNVVSRVPVVVPPNPFSAGYLEAKRLRMAHELPHVATNGQPLGRAANGDAE
ncbi:MAG: GTP cyclohydrolase II [Polyangiaceae bacterium]